jgi:hypothetical protein
LAPVKEQTVQKQLISMRNNKEGTGGNSISRAVGYGSRFIDYKMGVAGGIVMGVIVFGVNYFGLHEIRGALTAALKQGTYTFLFGGIIMRGCENLAIRTQAAWKALFAAVIIPSVVSIGLTFGVHSLRGTPRPVASTVPTAILVVPSTFVWGIRKRKQHSVVRPLNDLPKP